MPLYKHTGWTMTTTAEKVVAEVDKAVPEKRKALGRGLESLLPGGPRVVSSSRGALPLPSRAGRPRHTCRHRRLCPTRDAVVQIAIELIDENPYQTRDHFSAEALEELANSIRANWSGPAGGGASGRPMGATC